MIVDSEEIQIKSGVIVYVEAEVKHHFQNVTQALTLLDDFTGTAVKQDA